MSVTLASGSVPADAPDVSIVIPAYNEETRIGQCLATVVDFVRSRPYAAEVIVVDDGSDDATHALALEAAAGYPEVTVCQIAHSGKASAVLAGLEHASGRFAGFIDADLATPMETLDTCLCALHDGYGVAIASREGAGARRVGEPLHRHVMGRVFNGLVRLLAVPGIDDTQCGFKFFSSDLLGEILPRCHLYSSYAPVSRPRVTAFDVELLAIARRRGASIKVIPVAWVYGTSSKVNPILDTLQNVSDVLRVRYYATRGYYR
jgi:dolichyl-phosphate beta-glucosyltransferase